jgi:hypothetical protein
VVPIYKGKGGRDRSEVKNYRPVSWTLVCKQIEHVIAGYIRQVWDNSAWLYEGQHGFRPGYSRESHNSYSLSGHIRFPGWRIQVRCDNNRLFEGFLVPRDRLLKKIAASGVDSRVVVWIWVFLLGRSQMNFLRFIYCFKQWPHTSFCIIICGRIS